MWLMAAPAPQMGEEGRQRSLSSLAGWRLFLWERWPELGRHSLLRQGYLLVGAAQRQIEVAKVSEQPLALGKLTSVNSGGKVVGAFLQVCELGQAFWRRLGGTGGPTTSSPSQPPQD
mmetsp:Transcript_27020/g.57325  ORF Transcript_27020/g.57325 Transcript_27020/m.57325 type:complete len:117 (-) Transcript_27020:787-1137(-)